MNSAAEIKPTVFVVDADVHIRESLSLLIESYGHQARAFASADEFHQYYQADMPGCLILDAGMEPQSSLDLYRLLLKEGKRLPVIFVANDSDVSTAVAAVKLGAIEFLEKPVQSRTWAQQITKAFALDTTWREQAVRFLTLEQQFNSLTTREKETLDLVVQGETNKSMAAKLFISERAIKMRRANIMNKFKVRSIAELLDRTVTYRLLAEQRG
ncbi:MAG: response regulator transcription factor [Pirellulales bacterium]